MLIMAIGSFAALLWYAYEGPYRRAESAVPLIRADLNPTRVRPEQPGGMEVPHQNRQVLHDFDGEPDDPVGIETSPPGRSSDTASLTPAAEGDGEDGQREDGGQAMPVAEGDPDMDPGTAASDRASTPAASENDGIAASPPRIVQWSPDGEAEPAEVLIAREISRTGPVARAPAPTGTSDEPESTPETVDAPSEAPRPIGNTNEPDPGHANPGDRGSGAPVSRVPVETTAAAADGDMPAPPAVEAEAASRGETGDATPSVDPALESIAEPAVTEDTEVAAARPSAAATPGPAVGSEPEGGALAGLSGRGRPPGDPMLDQIPAGAPQIGASLAAMPAEPLTASSPTLRVTEDSPGRFQVAAATSEDEARRIWRTLEARFPDLLGDLDLVVPTAVVDGTRWFRVQAATVDRAEARRRCAALRARGADCFVR